MRLLNVNSMVLEDFVGDVPGYAILSHTWGKNEVTFDDVKHFRSKRDFVSAMSQDKRSAISDRNAGKAYEKVYQTADFARVRGFSYVWIDSCCIDKSSSAELSEAINSMFAWYQQAEICYAHLADLSRDSTDNIGLSRWFTRGWTLQELIAPREVIFVDAKWRPIGTRQGLRNQIMAATKVPGDVLDGASLDNVSAAVRMSWIPGRQTTLPEDIAYCLLGLFGVNMPLLYGEGKEKAFIRLQEEFLKTSDDESLFAWRTSPDEAQKRPYWSLLAPMPDYFLESRRYERSNILSLREGQPTMVTNRGLRVESSLSPLRGDLSGTIFLAVHHCTRNLESWAELAAIFLQRLSGHENQYARVAVDIILHPFQSILRLPFDRLTESFRRHVKGVRRVDRLEEPEPKYLFVRQSPRHSGLVMGFYVDKTADLCNGEVRICVTEWREPWEEWGETECMRWFSIDLEVGYDGSELKSFEAENLNERVTLGRMGVKVESWEPISRRRNWTETVYFVVGLEPLPENPLGTPAGFTRPWCAFLRDGIDGLTMSPSLILSEKHLLEIDFTLGIRWARVFYKIGFSITDVA